MIDSINVDKIKSKKITAVLDPVNGAGGAIAEALLTRIGVRYSTIHRQTDVPFERPAEPIPAHLKKLSEAVLKNKADIGFAQDPDADRLALVDETGRVLSEEYTLALAVKQVLRKTPGSVVVNLSTSSVIEKVTQAADCLLFRVSVGEVNVSKGIVEHGAVVGGEGNGGVIYPKINLARDSFVGIALILELMADTDKRLSELADELPKLVQKKEKVIFGGNLPKVFDMIKASFTDALVDNRDGLRLDWLDGDWVQVRTSNTEPVIRIIAESESEPKVDFILKTVRDIILKYDR